MTETNLENVKEEACFFARFPLIKTDMSPMIVHHPFIRSGYIRYINIILYITMQNMKNWEKFLWNIIIGKDIVNFQEGTLL